MFWLLSLLAAATPAQEEKIAETTEKKECKRATGIVSGLPTLAGPALDFVMAAVGLGLDVAITKAEKAEKINEVVKSYQQSPEEFKQEVQKALAECEEKLKTFAEKYNVKLQ